MKFGFPLLLFLCLALLGRGQNNTDRGYLVRVGQLAPDDFSLKLTDGTTTSLKALRGKVVLLQFTASWCSVCRKEIPHLEKEIWQPDRSRGLVLIGVDRMESWDTVMAYHREMGVDYPFAADPGAGIFGRFAQKSAGVTRNVLIDRTGRIVFLTRLYDPAEFGELKKQVNALLPL